MLREPKTTSDVHHMIFEAIRVTCEEIQELVETQLTLMGWAGELKKLIETRNRDEMAAPAADRVDDGRVDDHGFYSTNLKITDIKIRRQDDLIDTKRDQLNDLLELVTCLVVT